MKMWAVVAMAGRLVSDMWRNVGQIVNLQQWQDNLHITAENNG